jgi:subfamily B ATP-binding cassette protein MsbA
MTPHLLRREQYRRLLALVGQTVALQPWLFLAFLVTTTLAAITEGIGVGMLVPLIQEKSLNTGGVLPWLDSWMAGELGSSAAQRTATLAGILAVVILARGILQVSASYLSIALPRRVQTRLSIVNYDRLLNAGLDFFSRSDGGALRTLVQDYPQRVSSSIKSITDIVASAILAVIYVLLMLSVSWSMTVVAALLVGCAGLLVKRVLTLPLARTGLALSNYQERWNTLIYETGIGLKLVRLLGAESIMRNSFRRVVDGYLRRDALRQLIGEAQSPLMTSVGGLFVCGMLGYGASVSSGIDTAHLLVLVLCLYRLTGPISRILTCAVIVESNLDALQRLEDFSAQTRQSRQIDGSRKFAHLQRSIRFSDVSFIYPGSEQPALLNFSLEIGRGEMVALVGPSGAGKTSVVNLLGRLYDPQCGGVEIDGTDLREYEIATWRRRLAVVTQDITLFNMSVTDNLAFGQEGVTQDKLEQAAHRAAALDFISALPEGWDTNLGDRGTRLSGGQQQRLSITRAMLRDPDLLILDEATSQLDTLTEQSIQQMIDSYRRDRTIIVVAHRLSTIRRADRIVVMQDGRIVELGTHNDLLARESHYRKMLEAQQLDLVPDDAA